jgi:hypothetical protein
LPASSVIIPKTPILRRKVARSLCRSDLLSPRGMAGT